MNGNETAGPQPVPDLAGGSAGSDVTDDDRNRYGVLLDHAAERGLLSPAEYQVRLVELAEASSVEQLQRIVTELPAFGGSVILATAAGGPVPVPGEPVGPAAVPGRPVGPSPDSTVVAPELDAALWASLTPATPRRNRGNPWVILIVLVAVLMAALVGLALVAGHVSHAHTGGTTGAGVLAFRPLRL
ncbi:MAG TPA: DUF1707 domain-containing protein [Acidimicrobiales bacterium]